jgi:hypothetical protein
MAAPISTHWLRLDEPDGRPQIVQSYMDAPTLADYITLHIESFGPVTAPWRWVEAALTGLPTVAGLVLTGLGVGRDLALAVWNAVAHVEHPHLTLSHTGTMFTMVDLHHHFSPSTLVLSKEYTAMTMYSYDMQSLTHLDVAECALSEPLARQLLACVAEGRWGSLHTFGVQNTGLTGNVLAEAGERLGANVRLSTLSFKQERALGNGVERLLLSLATTAVIGTRTPGSLRLTLVKCGLAAVQTADSLASLIGSGGVGFLDVSENPLLTGSAVPCARLMDALALPSNRLVQLVVRNGYLQGMGALALALALLRTPVLSGLDLSYNHDLVVGPKPVMRQMDKALIAALSRPDSPLRTIDLTGCNTHLMLMPNFWVGLSHCRRLTELHQGHLPLSEQEVTVLAASLGYLERLIVLDLSNCNITDDKAEELAIGLVDHPSLEVLCLDHNPVTGVGVRHVASAWRTASAKELTFKRVPLTAPPNPDYAPFVESCLEELVWHAPQLKTLVLPWGAPSPQVLLTLMTRNGYDLFL